MPDGFIPLYPNPILLSYNGVARNFEDSLWHSLPQKPPRKRKPPARKRRGMVPRL